MKKLILTLLGIILLTSLINATSLDISFPNGNQFEAGQPITFKATLYDNNNNPMEGQVLINIEDAEKRVILEKTVLSKEVSSVDLGEKATSGQGIITAKYLDIISIGLFDIGAKELVRFELEGDTLKVTNIGNTKYSRIIKITIGETVGTQQPDLSIGESASYRLVAPDGVYNIKVSDGKTSLLRNDIQLTGTGQAIGAIDNSAASRSPFTGGISPNEKSDIALLSYIKNKTFVYVFILTIFGAMILIAIERRYRKRAGR